MLFCTFLFKPGFLTLSKLINNPAVHIDNLIPKEKKMQPRTNSNLPLQQCCTLKHLMQEREKMLIPQKEQ